MRKAADKGLLIAVGAILIFGLVMLTSASGPTGFQRFGDSYHFLKRQLLLGVLPGLVLLVIASRIGVERLRTLAPLAFYGAVGLLLLGFIPGIGAAHGSSWITVAGYSFQPSEVAKLLLVIYFAWWLARRGEERLKTFWGGLLPFVITTCLVIALMMAQSDLGTTAVILATLFSMYIAAKAPFRHLALLMAGALVLFLIFIQIAPYRADRLKVFLRPDLDPQGVGYHVNQAMLAVGNGGWLGVGLGQSRQKYLYLPEVAGDSIFAVTAEELGFFASAAVILAFLYLMRRGMTIAERAPDDFSRYVAIGITVWLVFQAFLNISAMLGLMPLTGVPLPFISHGGSAMLANLMAIGVLAAISREAGSTIRHKPRYS